jgi:hypothetical protein
MVATVSCGGQFLTRIGIYSRGPATNVVSPNLRRLLLDETHWGMAAALRTNTGANGKQSGDQQAKRLSAAASFLSRSRARASLAYVRRTPTPHALNTRRPPDARASARR